MPEISNLIDILSLFLGAPKSKDGGDSLQFQFNCPCCAEEKGLSHGDGKYNLEISLVIGKYHCWSCSQTHGTHGNIPKLIKDYGNPDILNKYKKAVSELKESKLYELYLSDSISISDTSLSLPESYSKIDLNNCNDLVSDYLLKRGINQDIINRFSIGYTNSTDSDFRCRNRIIIPSYDIFNDLNFWVGRDYIGKNNSLKYMNSEVNKSDIIFNERLINWDNDIYIVEGPFDAICMVPNTICLLGKSLKVDSLLFRTIIKKCNGRIIIVLDGDAVNDIKSIYVKLNNTKMRGRVFHIEIPNDLDPALIFQKWGKNGIIKLLKKETQYKEINLMQ